MARIDAFKRLCLPLLSTKGLHDVHARDMLLNEFVHSSYLVSHIDKSLFDDLLKDPSGDQQNRNRCQYHQGQLPINPKHRSDYHKQGKEVAHRIQDSVGKHIRYSVDVAHMPCHQGTHRRFIEIPQPKPSYMAEQLRPQVQTHRLSNPVGQIRDAVLQQRFKHHQPHYRNKNIKQQLRVVLWNGIIYCHPDQRRPYPNQCRK